MPRKGGSSKFGSAVTGGRHHTVWNDREHTLNAIKGATKGKKYNPYAIANAGHTKAGRKAMAQKAAATRKRKGK